LIKKKDKSNSNKKALERGFEPRRAFARWFSKLARPFLEISVPYQVRRLQHDIIIEQESLIYSLTSYQQNKK